jgi:hypothetical protein
MDGLEGRIGETVVVRRAGCQTKKADPLGRELLTRISGLPVRSAGGVQGGGRLFLGVASLLLPQAVQEEGGLLRYETPRAIVFYEPGPLSTEAMGRFTHLLDQGILDIQTYVDGAPRENRRRVVYYVRTDIPISWSFRHTVLLPMDRVKDQTAPYLHETTHILFPVRSGSVWFSEGFASFVQSYVAEHLGGYDGYVFSKGGNRNVDNLARRHLASEGGRAVLPFVGGDEAPPDLYTDRWGVAAPLYVLSHSFVKYLVEKAGLDPVKGLVEAPDIPARLQESTGKPIGEWKADWLRSLRAGDERRP